MMIKRIQNDGVRLGNRISGAISLVVLSSLLFSGVLSAEPEQIRDEDIFQQANAAFVEGHYEDAIRDFESLLRRDYFSPEVYYNLANAQYRAGRAGEAILNYERALWFAPRDADVRGNIKFVRNSLGLGDVTDVWWRETARWLTLDGWSWMAMFFWVSTCLLGIARLKGPMKGRIPVWLAGSCLILFVVAVAFLFIRRGDLDRAVVLLPETVLKVAPVEKSPSLGPLPQGTVVRFLKEKSGMWLVSTPDGREGWVETDRMERVVR